MSYHYYEGPFPVCEDRLEGVGPPVTIGSRVDVYYVLRVRRQGGSFQKFASLTTRVPPLCFTIGDPAALYGLSRYLEGMAIGGERLIMLPATHIATMSGVPGDATLCLKVKLWHVHP